MTRQTIAVLVMGSFIVFSCSCYSVQPIKPAMLSSSDAGKIKIFKVEKTSGESITFTKKSPGRILEREIVGTGSLTDAVETVEIANADLEKVTPKKGAISIGQNPRGDVVRPSQQNRRTGRQNNHICL